MEEGLPWERLRDGFEKADPGSRVSRVERSTIGTWAGGQAKEMVSM